MADRKQSPAAPQPQPPAVAAEDPARSADEKATPIKGIGVVIKPEVPEPPEW